MSPCRVDFIVDATKCPILYSRQQSDAYLGRSSSLLTFASKRRSFPTDNEMQAESFGGFAPRNLAAGNPGSKSHSKFQKTNRIVVSSNTFFVYLFLAPACSLARARNFLMERGKDGRPNSLPLEASVLWLYKFPLSFLVDNSLSHDISCVLPRGDCVEAAKLDTYAPLQFGTASWNASSVLPISLA